MELSNIEKAVNNLNGCEKEQYQFTIDMLSLTPVRDYSLRYVYDHPEMRENAIKTLGELLPATDDAFQRATLHTIRAGVYWLDENIDETRFEIQKALLSDNTYSLARLFNMALSHGVPASVWTDSLQEVTLDKCLMGADGTGEF